MMTGSQFKCDIRGTVNDINQFSLDIHQVRRTISGIIMIFNSSNFILLLTTFLFANDGTQQKDIARIENTIDQEVLGELTFSH